MGFNPFGGKSKRKNAPDSAAPATADAAAPTTGKPVPEPNTDKAKEVIEAHVRGNLARQQTSQMKANQAMEMDQGNPFLKCLPCLAPK